MRLTAVDTNDALRRAVVTLASHDVRGADHAPRKHKRTTMSRRKRDPKVNTAAAVTTCRVDSSCEHDVLYASLAECDACANVFYASAYATGVWSSCCGGWERPERWLQAIVEPLLTSVERRQTPTWCNTLTFGQYNAVVTFSSDALWKVSLPLVRNVDGGQQAHTALVVRVSKLHEATVESHQRQDRYQDMAEELRLTLLATRAGVAPTCYAAFVFKFDDVRGGRPMASSSSYGLFLLLSKCDSDLDHALSAAVTRARNGCAQPNVHLYATSPLQRDCGILASRTLEVVVEQSRCGFFNFDSKPANVLLTTDGLSRLIDFDPTFCVRRSPSSDQLVAFAPQLLLNLLLLSAHVCSFHEDVVWRGWTCVVRSTLLQAIRSLHCEDGQWLREARVRPAPLFEVVRGSSDDALRRRLEIVATSYFVRPAEAPRRSFDARLGFDAPTLVAQLLRFIFTGSARNTTDLEVEHALGYLNAPERLAAQMYLKQ